MTMHDTPHTISHLTPRKALDNVLKLYHDTALTKVRSFRLDKALAELSATLNGEILTGPTELPWTETGKIGKEYPPHITPTPTQEPTMQDLRARLKSDARRVFHFDTLTLPDWIIAMAPSVHYREGHLTTLEVGDRKASIGEWIVEVDSNGVEVFTDENFRNAFDVVPE